MGMIKSMVKNEEIKEQGKTMIDELVYALVGGDIVALEKFLKNILKSPYFIQTQIFWQNFIDYLDNACPDKDSLRKLSEMLAEDGNSNENAKRIIKIIDDAGTKKKAIYLSNLTRACCMESISVSQFFKLSQCIVRLTDEDLTYLNENINGAVIEDDEEFIDDFRFCGLLKEVAGGFVYTKRAFELKKYSLSYGHNVEIPNIPKRQMQLEFEIEDITEQELNEICKINE